ncbi:hypothetical protein IBL26_23330 [Roseomonas aerophila]|uniref:PH domain-containing protein n=1 Tax=Teichococcus aerophilus TaxID=1224513 RepID=A0ABR7RT22_9PROT|nr:hypothetical protein [Pseudoroseomonas aerophila]MBC9209789.1 hypothetical protein [Pseudoroseomonas aerophila]
MQDFRPGRRGPADPEAAAHLQQQLQPGEWLVWTGQPSAEALVLSRLFPAVVGLTFLALLLPMAIGAQHVSLLSVEVHGQKAFPLIALAFIGVASWYVASAPLAWFGAQHIYYGVTNRRVLRLCLWPIRFTTSWPPQDINDLHRKPGIDGTATVIFHRNRTYQALRQDAFHGVTDADGAEAALRALRDG